MWLYFILHKSSSLSGLYICLIINIHTSAPYTTSGLISGFISLSFIFLFISLFLNICILAQYVLFPACILSFMFCLILFSSFSIVPEYVKLVIVSKVLLPIYKFSDLCLLNILRTFIYLVLFTLTIKFICFFNLSILLF